MSIDIEGNLNNIQSTIVLVSYKMVAGKLANSLCYILTTDIELSNDKIIEYYLNRWDIEVSFRFQKNSFGLKNFQIRGLKGMKRFWSIVYLVHNFVVLEVFKVSQNTRKTSLGEIIAKYRTENFSNLIGLVCEMKDSGEKTSVIIDRFLKRVA